jgi:mono/diheme cytochrome c family protein
MVHASFPVEVSSMSWKVTTGSLLAAVAVAVSSFAADNAGKDLFVKNECNSCHSVESQGIAAERGEDKASDMSNAAALIPSADWGKKFVLREETKDGKKHKKPYKGTEKDLEQMIAWLMTLKTS